MIKITLPDGSVRHYDNPISINEIALSIGSGLARAAIAGKVGNHLVDTSYIIHNDSKIAIITAKDSEGLEIIRHSTAHLLAYAVQSLFPDAQVTIGPVIEDGFYYDFSYKRPFTPDDLVLIEKKMSELAKENHTIIREEIARNDAIDFFLKKGEKYKAEIIQSIPQDEILFLYKMGDFIDLCRGPHVPATGILKVFKLMKVAGAYWRGNSDNEMLQRIYGTAWINKDDLKNYLFKIEEAEKRDHRKLGKQLNLFHLQDEAPGMVFWHPKGWTLWQLIEQYIRKELDNADYLEIKTPMIMDKNLWEKSGHWENYHENMFITSSEKREYAVKPMNCPGHVQIFNKSLRSYKELPLRFAEFGCCHRNEPSGALHGLMRVRGFVQDDAHIFCTEQQIVDETIKFHNLLKKVYKRFGFDDIVVKISLRPEKYAGGKELWDRAEQGLRDALTACHVEWEELEGEGAFYGPKIEYQIKDAIGRLWQCGTLQLDYVLPERLNAEYITEYNTKERPVMLHRAIIGSFERFIGILIEHHAGQFPTWLAPKQVCVMNISEHQKEYTQEVHNKLKKSDIRSILDIRNEKISYKIREHSLQRIPYQIIIGDSEKEQNLISVRTHGKDLGLMNIDNFIAMIEEESLN